MRVAKQTLTVKSINQARLKSGETKREISDTTRGLRLLIYPNRKALAWRGTVKGNGQVRATFAEWPQESDKQLGVLTKARSFALAHNAECAEGRNPLAKSEEESEAERAALSVGEVAKAYFTFVKGRVAEGKRSESQAEEMEAMLRRRLQPLWHEPYLETGRKALQPHLDALKDQGKPRAAGRLFEGCKAMANAVAHLAEFEDLEDDMLRHPWITMKGEFMVPEKVKRDRVLNEREIAAVWKAAEGLGYPYGPVVQLLFLSGCRLTEVSETDVRELDFEEKEWTVPADRNKTGREFVVPLPDMAIAILESLPRFVRKDSEDNYVFTTTGGERPVSGFSKYKARLDKAALAILKEDNPDAELPPWRLHDIRRTVRTGLSELHVSEDTSEMVLNHALKGLTAIYNRHDFKDRRREALELWAARMREIVGPTPDDTESKVTRLDSRRKAIA